MIFAAFRRRSALNFSAYELYRQAVEQARRPAFYARCGVPDTFDGRFDMLILHVFLLLHRLRAEGKAGAGLGQKLFDVTFAHLDQSLREMGAGDLGVGKRVKAMARAFYGRAAAYDAALEESSGALTQALVRNVYGRAAPKPAEVERLARYVRAAAERLEAQPSAQLYAGKADFGPAPEDP